MIQKDKLWWSYNRKHKRTWSKLVTNSWSSIQRLWIWKKTNPLFNLIHQQPHIDKIYLQFKDLHKSKYQFLINKRESTGLKHFNDSKAFIEYSNYVDDIYKYTEEYNPNKNDNDIIAGMLSNKKLRPILTN